MQFARGPPPTMHPCMCRPNPKASAPAGVFVYKKTGLAASCEDIFNAFSIGVHDALCANRTFYVHGHVDHE